MSSWKDEDTSQMAEGLNGVAGKGLEYVDQSLFN
jgi:hypothetical protein